MCAAEGVGEETTGVDDELFGGLQCHTVDLAAADERHEAAAGEEGVAPVGETLGLLVCVREAGGEGGVTSFGEMVGREVRECPVHARRASFCVSIQSTWPSSSMTPKVVCGVFVDMRQVSGVEEDICGC